MDKVFNNKVFNNKVFNNKVILISYNNLKTHFLHLSSNQPRKYKRISNQNNKTFKNGMKLKRLYLLVNGIKIKILYLLFIFN